MTVGTVPGMSYPSDLTDDQWALLAPVFNAPGKRGRKHADDRSRRLAGGRAGRARFHPREPSQRADAGALGPAGCDNRLELVLVDRGVTAPAVRTLGRAHDLEVRRVGWDDKQPVFRPIRQAWRVEVAHGRLGRSRRLAKSFENAPADLAWLLGEVDQLRDERRSNHPEPSVFTKDEK